MGYVHGNHQLYDAHEAEILELVQKVQPFFDGMHLGAAWWVLNILQSRLDDSASYIISATALAKPAATTAED